MLSIQTLLASALVASTALAQNCTRVPSTDPGVGVPPYYGFPPHPPFECGKVDVFFTGLPPNHPLVISQGYPPDFVASSIATDKQSILKAGYNLKTVLQGPEQPISNDVKELSLPKGIQYDAAIIGAGVRAALLVNLTAQLESEISLFRQKIPHGPIGFNVSPFSTTDALKRVAPIRGDCTNKPGKDLGTFLYCKSDFCTAPYSPKLGTTYG